MWIKVLTLFWYSTSTHFLTSQITGEFSGEEKRECQIIYLYSDDIQMTIWILSLITPPLDSEYVLSPIFTVASVWNTGETGDINTVGDTCYLQVTVFQNGIPIRITSCPSIYMIIWMPQNLTLQHKIHYQDLHLFQGCVKFATPILPLLN